MSTKPKGERTLNKTVETVFLGLFAALIVGGIAFVIFHRGSKL